MSKRYIGVACTTCGGNVRYKKTDKCKQCSDSKNMSNNVTAVNMNAANKRRAVEESQERKSHRDEYDF